MRRAMLNAHPPSRAGPAAGAVCGHQGLAPPPAAVPPYRLHASAQRDLGQARSRPCGVAPPVRQPEAAHGAAMAAASSFAGSALNARPRNAAPGLQVGGAGGGAAAVPCLRRASARPPTAHSFSQARPAVRGRQQVVCAAGGGGQAPKKGGDSLEDRIASGEFTDAGSTKERMTRPLRRILAKDPVGPGEPVCCCWRCWGVLRWVQLCCWDMARWAASWRAVCCATSKPKRSQGSWVLLSHPPLAAPVPG